jgi:hypothetical protein
VGAAATTVGVTAIIVSVMTTATTATAFLMRMTVLKLLFGSGTHFLNGYVEIQVLTSQRVVAVDSDIVAFDLNNTNGDRPLLGAGLELHTDFEGFDTLKTVTWHNLLQGWIRLAVTIFRLDTHFNRLADSLAG